MTFRKLAESMLIVISLASVHGRMTAQTAVDGAIGGNVKDKTGAFVSGAAVTLKRPNPPDSTIFGRIVRQVDLELLDGGRSSEKNA